MRLIVKRFYYIILLSVTIPSIAMSLKEVLPSHRVRIRRQEGYVYDKPIISFDLPSPPAIESTQAPTVDRTLVQKMSYIYPTPAGGDTTDNRSKGGNGGSTASATPTGGSSGYNYRSSGTNNAGAGYNYGSSASSVVQENNGGLNTNIASQTVTNFQPATNTGSAGANPGYGNNIPSPTLSPSLQGPAVSTSAPKYLPPAAGTGNENSGSSSSVSGASNSRQVSTSVGIPSDNYLPPIGSQANLGGSVSVPNEAYLPPISAPPVLAQPPSPLLKSTSQPAPPSGIYIPSSNVVQNSGSVAAPASGYLPPRFF